MPRSHVERHDGAGVYMLFNDASRMVCKYVYVSDGHLTGNAINSNGSFSLGGASCTNNSQVLTEVLGI